MWCTGVLRKRGSKNQMRGFSFMKARGIKMEKCEFVLTTQA